MSNKDLTEDLNHLRIRYGTSNVYRTLMKLLREEYDELSSLFGVSSNTHPTSTFYPTSPQDYYAAFMSASAEAAHDTLQEYTPAPASFYDLETESVNDESSSLEAEEFTLEDEMKLIDDIFNTKNNTCWPTANPLKGGSAETELIMGKPILGESADTPQETPLKIIQTDGPWPSLGSRCEPTGGAGAASEDAPKKKLLKKKPASEAVEVIKETPPAKPKKTKAT
jgi:hypothetical protein